MIPEIIRLLVLWWKNKDNNDNDDESNHDHYIEIKEEEWFDKIKI